MQERVASSQTLGRAQSLTEEHWVLHEEPSQAYGAQSVVVPSGFIRVLASLQEAPVLGTQSPLAASHRNFSEQSASDLHETAQALPLQTKGSQRTGSGSEQPPLPSQSPPGFAVPSTQEGSLQATAMPT
jgi:hypothetical protein